ncbi:TIGR03936 family radical SAM-associated protein [Candidatus Omnitrophota bacterium]
MKRTVRFSKSGEMRYISHLDLVRLFHRASRRAGIPVTITKGFSPRLKISIERALKLGVESLEERAAFYLDERMDPGPFKDRLNANLPEGVRITDVEEDN